MPNRVAGSAGESAGTWRVSHSGDTRDSVPLRLIDRWRRTHARRRRNPLAACGEPVRGPRSSPAVRPGDDLEEVPVGVEPVHAPATVVGVDLTRVALEGIGPVIEAAGPDAGEDLVELLLGHQERVVPRMDLLVVREV